MHVVEYTLHFTQHTGVSYELIIGRGYFEDWGDIYAKVGMLSNLYYNLDLMRLRVQ